ncbi:hypothetical protein HID58_015650 [Brassica napus]|uniref:Uncharacterized protein n=1 Tax=Brassica napus TaxID=3708 RepID=A0ABQ8DKU4_BRANA|nr:hypothetical protein HID58_015650 [Brassica napus]
MNHGLRRSYYSTNRFVSLVDVNQWMQKTVRSLLMSSGSSFVSSLMPGSCSVIRLKLLKFRFMMFDRFAKRKLDESVFLGNSRVSVTQRTRRWSTNSIEETLPLLEFHLTRSILGSSSMNQTVKTVREKLDKIQESGNQKRIIQPISQNLQIEPDFEENPSSR